MCADKLNGSLTGHVYELCHGDFSVVMNTAAGRIDEATSIGKVPQEKGLTV